MLSLWALRSALQPPAVLGRAGAWVFRSAGRRAGPGSGGGLGARWGLQSPLPFLHICFSLQPREVGATTFILDTKKQSLRGTQVLPGPDVCEQEAWASGSLSPPFPEPLPSCPAGPLGLSPLPLDHPRTGDRNGHFPFLILWGFVQNLCF